MELRVLGPLEVWRDGELVELRGTKRRALLALLILHANEVVRTDRLIDELWGEERPANASAALQNHVSRLRKDLGADVVVTKPWGYVLRADPDSVDLQRFERLVVEAKPLAAAQRKEKLTDALALWRGAPLADLSHEPAIAAEMRRLEELRLSALEQRIDADLELGGSLELVAELEALIAEHPLRERLRGQLILALYRGGRQAEALETYRETRRVLVEELGIEPSPELRELERAILRQDPALVVTPPLSEPTGPEPETARWRWPRSPLAAAAVLLLLVAGAALAVVLSRTSSPAQTHAASPAPPPALAPPPPAPQPPPPPSPKPSISSKKSKPKPTESHPVVTVVTPPASPPPPTTTQITDTSGTQTTSTKPKPPLDEKPATQSTTTVKSPPSSASPPPVWDYWLTDDFENPAIDFAMWHVATSNEAAVHNAEQNGRLELTVDPGAVPTNDFFDTNYGTQCGFSADFDARVEFTLVNWPAQDGINVYLAPWFQGADMPTFVGRTGASPGTKGFANEMYTTGLRAYGNGVPTADTSGALRATRVDGNITTYYRYRGQWIKLGSRFERGVVWSLLIGINANAGEFGFKLAVVAFDNFRATAPEGTVGCEGVPYPPRKPRPKT